METSHLLKPGAKTRRYDNDWLTVLGMLTIFFFHCARFFNDEGWHVKNNQISQSLTLFVAVTAQWIMPLFFLLSGFSSYYALRSRTNGQFIRNRFMRLVIPLLFGMFIFLVPVQVWIERVSTGEFDGSFLAFYPLYFKGFYAFGGNFAWMGLHLWYLEVLFIFTLLMLPIFQVVLKARSQKLISTATAFFERSGAIFLLGLPLFVMEWLVNLQPDGVGMRNFGGWSLFSYLILLFMGFLIAGDLKYRAAMQKNRIIALAFALLTTSLMFFFRVDLTALGETGAYSLMIFTRSVNTWCWLVAILGFGSQYLNTNNALLKYAREAVLPFYILHQTVIVIMGFLISNWTISVFVKYIILSTVSFTVIVALYEVVIRRVNALRFLFGMHRNK